MAKKTSIELFREVESELNSDSLKPVYTFCGEEEFFLDRLQELVEKMVPEDQKDFNFDLLYGKEITPARLLSIVRSFPMMAERRVVILRDFGGLGEIDDEAVASGDAGTVNDLIPYVEQPNPTTLFVIIDTKKPAGNTKIGKLLQKGTHTGFYEFKPVPDYRLPEWIGDWIRTRHRKKISPDSARMLAQYAGNNLQVLSTEIDKVCTFVDTSDTIEESDIKKIIGLYREYSVFELKDALVARDLDQALFISEQILQQSKADTGEVIRTVGFFYNMFSNIWQIRRLAASGMNREEVREKMGVNHWYFKNLWKDSSSYQLNEMPRVFEALLDADRAAKGFTKLDPATILLLMIKRIIN